MRISFTIVAKNYIGLAKVLAASIKKYANHTLYIIVADELGEALTNEEKAKDNIIEAKYILNISGSLWSEMAFKYNLVEFCTAIKPFCFEYFFSSLKAEKVVYLDPDVFFFNSIDAVFKDLDDCSVLLTPHITSIQNEFSGEYPINKFLANGIFNLGFCGIKNTEAGLKVVFWWQSRLKDECFFDNDQGLATDQKWMDFLPAIMDKEDLKISKNLGYNMAPWNFFEREVIQQDVLKVFSRLNNKDEEAHNLVFVHFSSFNYKGVFEGSFSHTTKNYDGYKDLNVVFDLYIDAIKQSSFLNYIQLQYAYNSFDNGYLISSLNRRLFRRFLIEEEAKIGNPFLTGQNSYYNILQRNSLIDKSKFSSDTLSNKNIENFDKKMGLVNSLFKIVKKLLGQSKYRIFIRFFRRYFKEENQYFLINNKKGNHFF